MYEMKLFNIQHGSICISFMLKSFLEKIHPVNSQCALTQNDTTPWIILFFLNFMPKTMLHEEDYIEEGVLSHSNMLIIWIWIQTTYGPDIYWKNEEERKN